MKEDREKRRKSRREKVRDTHLCDNGLGRRTEEKNENGRKRDAVGKRMRMGIKEKKMDGGKNLGWGDGMRKECKKQIERANRVLFSSSYSWLVSCFCFVLNLLIFSSYHSLLIFFFLLSVIFSLTSQLFFSSSFQKIFNQRLSEFEKKNLWIVCFLPLSLVSLLLITSILFSHFFLPALLSLSHLLYVLNFSLSFIPTIFVCLTTWRKRMKKERIFSLLPFFFFSSPWND